MTNDMAVPDDRYFAGRIVDEPGGKPDGKPPVRDWIVVCAVNLIVPVFLGWGITDDRGRIGMALGIVVVLALGYRACFSSPEVVRTIAYGGWLVAFTQCIPFVQFIAGFVGVGVAQELGLASEGGIGLVSTIMGGFVATLITGGLLIALAVVIGMACRGLAHVRTGK